VECHCDVKFLSVSGIRLVEKADVLLNSKAQDAEGPQLTLPNCRRGLILFKNACYCLAASSASTALSKLRTPSSFPTTARIPTNLAADSNSSVL
jgi:hypothetical protein